MPLSTLWKWRVCSFLPGLLFILIICSFTLPGPLRQFAFDMPVPINFFKWCSFSLYPFLIAAIVVTVYQFKKLSHPSVKAFSVMSALIVLLAVLTGFGVGKSFEESDRESAEFQRIISLFEKSLPQ